MVTFATLFLGLVLGAKPVEVVVDETVSRVEIQVDGEAVARLDGPPWRVHHDFGDELAPRRLEAVALDAAGRELGRAEQWINLPRPPAEAKLLLAGGDNGRGVVARLIWESIAGERPLAASATFDGRPLAFDDMEAIPLPPHDPRQLHFLRVELDFPGNVTSVVETTFGGGFADQVSAELTAVPIVVSRPKVGADRERLASWFVDNGTQLEVLAVDKGPAELLIVCDRGARSALARIAASAPRTLSRSGFGTRPLGGVLRFAARMRKDSRARFIAPVAERLPRRGYAFEVFPSSRELTHEDGGLYWLLARLQPSVGLAATQRLADAVAVAGMSVARSNRRRAVLLVLGSQPEDRGELTPQQVRRYLARLRVPLLVASTDPESGDVGWGEPLDLSSLTRMEAAAKQLNRLLESQRIVWLEGIHLPQRIALAEGAEGIRLAM